MFKKHSVQVKMVKDQPSDTVEKVLNIDAEKINKIVTESVKSITLGVVTVVGSLTVINAIAEIAINASPKKH